MNDNIDIFNNYRDYNSNNTIWNVYENPNSYNIKIINTENELISFVNENKYIRVIGGGMNWNGACFSKNTIRLGKDFCNYKINYTDKSITVGSSCMIYNIHNFLLEKNFQLNSIGYCIWSNKSQTIGGVCATNVHHTGKKLYPFSENCTSIVVLHFNSSKHAVINTYYPKDIFFKYFFGSIGTLGILLYATFSIKPLNYYKIKTTTISKYNTSEINNRLTNDNGFYLFNDEVMTTYKLYKLNKIDIKKILLNPYNKNFDNTTITPYINSSIPKLPIKLINFILPFFPSTERIVKSISHLSDSKHLLIPHIEIEFYICENNTSIIINLINKFKLYEKYIIALRYVPKINNSLFTLTSKNNMVSVSLSSFNLNKHEMNKLFSFITKQLQILNILWYPHFGKFIGDNYKFSNCFDLTTYNIIRESVDPDKKFISKFN
jgi:hypothetical protein